jgi:hypothetical protein
MRTLRLFSILHFFMLKSFCCTVHNLFLSLWLIPQPTVNLFTNSRSTEWNVCTYVLPIGFKASYRERKSATKLDMFTQDSELYITNAHEWQCIVSYTGPGNRRTAAGVTVNAFKLFVMQIGNYIVHTVRRLIPTFAENSLPSPFIILTATIWCHWNQYKRVKRESSLRITGFLGFSIWNISEITSQLE